MQLAVQECDFSLFIFMKFYEYALWIDSAMNDPSVW